MSSSRRRARLALVDAETGVERRLVEGPTQTAGDALKADLGRARRVKDLGWAFAFILGLNPSRARVAALHVVLGRKGWHKVDGTAAAERYLHVAVRREAARIALRWRMDGILTEEQQEREYRAVVGMGQSRRPARSPEAELDRKEAAARARATLVRLRAVGNDRDQSILDLLARGYEPAEALKSLGLPWSAWQAFQRKARRKISWT